MNKEQNEKQNQETSKLYLQDSAIKPSMVHESWLWLNTSIILCFTIP